MAARMSHRLLTGQLQGRYLLCFFSQSWLPCSRCRAACGVSVGHTKPTQRSLAALSAFCPRSLVGSAGLVTARQLQNKGYKVLVLEGHDRPGGRVYTKRLEVRWLCSPTGLQRSSRTCNGLVQLFSQQQGKKRGTLHAILDIDAIPLTMQAKQPLTALTRCPGCLQGHGVSCVADLGGSIITGIDGNPLTVLAKQLRIPLHEINSTDVMLYMAEGLQADQKLDDEVRAVAQLCLSAVQMANTRAGCPSWNKKNCFLVMLTAAQACASTCLQVEKKMNQLLDECSRFRDEMGEVSDYITLGTALETIWSGIAGQRVANACLMQKQRNWCLACSLHSGQVVSVPAVGSN